MIFFILYPTERKAKETEKEKLAIVAIARREHRASLTPQQKAEILGIGRILNKRGLNDKPPIPAK